MLRSWFRPKSTRISVVVVFHNMRREALRTLKSLSPTYQVGVSSEMYEVIAVDSNSTEPLGPELVTSFGGNFRYLTVDWSHPSPCRAMNLGVAAAKYDTVMCIVDGARILSPGILQKALGVFDSIRDPFVYTLGMHLGPKVQNESIIDGYNQEVEDRLIDSIPWEKNGYLLFSVSSVALSSKAGFYSKLSESNCFAVSKQRYDEIGGFDERFITPGGGLINLDIFNRLTAHEKTIPVMLLGESTFHQFHGGVATNVPLEKHPWELFAEEYRRIRGRDYSTEYREPFYYGELTPESKHLAVDAS